MANLPNKNLKCLIDEKQSYRQYNKLHTIISPVTEIVSVFPAIALSWQLFVNVNSNMVSRFNPMDCRLSPTILYFSRLSDGYKGSIVPHCCFVTIVLPCFCCSLWSSLWCCTHISSINGTNIGWVWLQSDDSCIPSWNAGSYPWCPASHGHPRCRRLLSLWWENMHYHVHTTVHEKTCLACPCMVDEKTCTAMSIAQYMYIRRHALPCP